MEKETAIRFAEWIAAVSDYSWNDAHNKWTKWSEGWGTPMNPISTEHLFDLFLQDTATLP